MKTLNEQYRLIKNDKGHKDVFLKEAKRIYPNFITNASTFNEASKILKNKGIISENFVGMSPINNPFGDKKQEGYEKAFEKFIKEATEVKAEEKKVSKEVEEDQKRTYDNKDKKDPNNMIFGQIQAGYYCELKNPKNSDKTEQEIKDIVFKNLAKDPIYYTKNGQFGEEIGYTDEFPSLGPTEEPKGPYKSSGYGKLKEHSISMAGGIVTGDGFTSQNYMDFYGLNEAEGDVDDAKETADEMERAAAAAKEIGDTELFEEDDDFENMDEILKYIKEYITSNK